MGLRIAEMLSVARRRPGEFCWMTTCRAFDVAEKTGRTPGYDQLRHLTLTALDRCRVTGQLSSSQINLLVEFGNTGPPRADSAKRIVWDRALDVLEAEMNHMVYPSNPPKRAPHFFYGSNGSPFESADEAWYWTLDCLDARHEGSRAEASLKVGRPCDPDDVVNAMRRLELSPVHCRTVVAWGKKRIEPYADTDARRFWDEAMARLGAVLREKGIVKTRHRATDLEVMDLPMTALKSIPVRSWPPGGGKLPPARKKAVPGTLAMPGEPEPAMMLAAE